MALTLAAFAVQVVLLAYSYTRHAREVASVDGTEAPTLRLGVYDAHWVALRLIGPLGATATPPFEVDRFGFRFMSARHECAFVEVHFAWTLAANLIIAGVLARGVLLFPRETRGLPVAG